MRDTVQIPKQDRDGIQARLAADLHRPVKIDYFHQRSSPVLIPGQEPCRSCADVKSLLEQLAALSDQIDLHIYEFADEPALAAKRGIDRVPGIVVRGEINRPLRLYGLPGGHFFPILLQAIVDVSGKPPTPPPEVQRLLKKLRREVRLQVLGSPMHPSSATAVMQAFQFALASPRINAWAYVIEESPALAHELGVTAIPTTLVNGRTAFSGLTSATDLAAYLYELQAQPRKAVLHTPKVEPGSAVPWQPPAPPHPAGPTSAAPAGRTRAGPPAGGGRRTPGGLILPGR